MRVSRALFQAAKSEGRKGSQQLLSDFGHAFEDYATDILGSMYPRWPGLVDRLARNVKGRDGNGREFEIDAALADVSQVALFEIKAAFPLENAVTNPRPTGRRCRAAGAIVRGSAPGLATRLRPNAVHPVLVAHDLRLDAPVLGQFLENEFRQLLGPVPRGKHVRPLTVCCAQAHGPAE
jgi:hypothetical protein